MLLDGYLFKEIESAIIASLNFMLDASELDRGLRYGGPTTESKNLKTPFFCRYSKFLLTIDWKWSKTYPVFFVSKYLNK